MKTKTITIHINLDSLGIRLLLLVILLTSLGGSIAFAQDGGSPANPLILVGSSARKYYLTSGGLVHGNDVLTACAAGYHAATVWEILDVSNLMYDTALGYKYVPGDGAPPTGMWGWVRTGGIPSIGPGPGDGNCGVWSQDIPNTYGSIIQLPSDWSAPGSTIGVWKTGFSACTSNWRVWCVGD